MRISDFAPLYRSTVGFDRLFERLESNMRPAWPPYDIERIGEHSYRVTMALAGFSIEDIELTQQGSVLVIAGKKEEEKGQREGMLHQGLAFRNFRQTFNLADHLKVTGANLVNGMLTVDLVREIPEALQPRRIAIGTESPREPAGQIATSAQTDRSAKAA